MDQNTVLGRQFAEKANIKYLTLLSWGHLNPTRLPSGWIIYDRRTLDAWLAASACGFAVPPTTADIMDNRVRLLTIQETRLRLPHIPPATLRRHAQLGRIPTLKFSPHMRMYSADTVERLAHRPQFYTLVEVCKMLAMRGPDELRRAYIRTGRLPLSADPLNPKRLCVLHDDLVALLPQQLPSRIDPEDWICDRLADPEWPMRVLAAATYAAKGIREIRDLISADRLDYIWTPSKTERRIPADALLFYIEQHPLAEAEIAHFYGVSHQSVNSWRQSGYLNCTAHMHSDNEVLYFACLMARARKDNPGIKPISYYKTRQRSASRLLSIAQASAILGLPMKTVSELALNNKISSIVTPAGARRFSPSTVTRSRRKLSNP